MFRTFEHTVFRLEVRDAYNEPNEQEDLRRFLAGDRGGTWISEGWLDTVRRAITTGRRWSRVRVVTTPLTDYSRFGIWCAQYTVGAGEDIRYLDRAGADELPDHDYWLFDSQLLVRMHFDDNDDRFVRAEVEDDPSEVVRHNYWRDAAWHHAVPLDDFADQQNVEHSPSA